MVVTLRSDAERPRQCPFLAGLGGRSGQSRAEKASVGICFSHDSTTTLGAHKSPLVPRPEHQTDDKESDPIVLL